MRNASRIVWGLILCGWLAGGPISPASAQTAWGKPKDCTPDASSFIATGATAQPLFSPFPVVIHGFQIMNIDTTEPLWIRFTISGGAAGPNATPAVAGAVNNYAIAAATATTFAGAGSYSSQGSFSTTINPSIVAATTNHKYSCTYW